MTRRLVMFGLAILFLWSGSGPAQDDGEMKDVRELDDALNLADELGRDGWLLGGGQDTYGWLKDRAKHPRAMIDLNGIEALKGIRESGDGLEIGAATTLSRYQSWRAFDSATLAVGTDIFTRLFSNDIEPIRQLRGIGMSIVNKIPPARRFFMRQAGGETGDPPRLLRGEKLTSA